jgi:hypothetical protein
MVKSDLDQTIMELADRTDRKTLATWGCDCAERVLPYFEEKYPDDDRPRKAIAAGRAWVATGVFRMADVRGVSLAAHAAARIADADGNDAARSAARAAGQAMAAAHVGRHAIAAAIYAATAVRDGTEAAGADAAVAKERGWQLRHLIELRENKG